MVRLLQSQRIFSNFGQEQTWQQHSIKAGVLLQSTEGMGSGN